MSSAIHTALQAALAAAAATYLLYKRVTTNDRSQVSDMTAIGFYQPPLSTYILFTHVLL